MLLKKKKIGSREVSFKTRQDRLNAFLIYLEMCGNFPEMEKDGCILENSHKLSLHRNYQDFWIYDYFKKLKMRDYVYCQCLHSFSGENDNLILSCLENGIEDTRQLIRKRKINPVIRTHLFQQFWSKGTDTREFLSSELYELIAPKFYELLKRGGWKIMSGAEKSYKWMQTHTTQSRLKYATKDVWLDFSLVYPHLVFPESFLEMGPGARRGAEFILGEKIGNEMNFYSWVIENLNSILKSNKISRIEAQVCYFRKYVYLKFGI